MPFESGAEAEKVRAPERPAGQFIETMQHAKPDGDAAAKSAGSGNRALDGPVKCERTDPGLMKK